MVRRRFAWVFAIMALAIVACACEAANPLAPSAPSPRPDPAEMYIKIVMMSPSEGSTIFLPPIGTAGAGDNLASVITEFAIPPQKMEEIKAEIPSGGFIFIDVCLSLDGKTRLMLNGLGTGCFPVKFGGYAGNTTHTIAPGGLEGILETQFVIAAISIYLPPDGTIRGRNDAIKDIISVAEERHWTWVRKK